MSLSEFRMSQRQQNKEDWIAYYQQRIAQARGLVAYYQERLDYVKGLKPDGDPPRRGSIVTHSQLGMGDDRVSLGDLPEPSRNGHVQKQSNKEVSA
jgi:hypothetical protein